MLSPSRSSEFSRLRDSKVLFFKGRAFFLYARYFTIVIVPAFLGAGLGVLLAGKPKAAEP